LIQTRTLILDTEDAVLYITGNIDLAQEKLDLTINPKTKGLRIISLRAPLYVKGDFKTPKVSIDKGVVALKSGGVIALGVLAPVAALLPLINVGSQKEEDNKCAVLLKEARDKPVSPPPGKTYKERPRKKQGG
jgi:hypothetical protein